MRELLEFGNGIDDEHEIEDVFEFDFESEIIVINSVTSLNYYLQREIKKEEDEFIIHELQTEELTESEINEMVDVLVNLKGTEHKIDNYKIELIIEDLNPQRYEELMYEESKERAGILLEVYKEWLETGILDFVRIDSDGETEVTKQLILSFLEKVKEYSLIYGK